MKVTTRITNEVIFKRVAIEYGWKEDTEWIGSFNHPGVPASIWFNNENKMMAICLCDEYTEHREATAKRINDLLEAFKP